MARQTNFLPKYQNSWALVIGIDAYPNGPLNYAGNDARAVADVLVTKFGFAKDNVKLLLDGEATKQAILDALLVHADVGHESR